MITGGKSRLRTEVQEPQSFMGNGLWVWYWWQVQTISPRYVGGESNWASNLWRPPSGGLERRCKGPVCNRSRPPPPPPPPPSPWERLPDARRLATPGSYLVRLLALDQNGRWASESRLPRSPLPISDHQRVLTATMKSRRNTIIGR